jgi:ATP-dependent RNA helicase RhlB
LDEADRMFDLGFIKDIRYVLRRLPPRDQRQCLMFSATLSHRVLELAYEHMNDPELLRVETEQVTAEHVNQTVYYPANEEKPRLLAGLLRQLAAVASWSLPTPAPRQNGLSGSSMQMVSCRGNIGTSTPETRQTLLRKFHDGGVPIWWLLTLLPGLHIPDVTHVINYDLPQDAPDYVHRIGRTARLGAKGEAISFACENFAFHLPEIEEFIGYEIPVKQVDRQLLVEINKPPHAPQKAKPSPGGQRHRRTGGGEGGSDKSSSSRSRHRRRPAN